MVKISILTLYRRIFDTVLFRKQTLIVGSLCIVWCLLAIIVNIFQCRPFNAAFDMGLLFTYHCIDVQYFYWGLAASNLGLDLVLLCMPIHQVWMLILSKGKRIMLSGIFLLGGL